MPTEQRYCSVTLIEYSETGPIGELVGGPVQDNSTNVA